MFFRMGRNLNSGLRAFSLLLIGFLTLSCSRSVSPVPPPAPTPALTLTPTATPTLTPAPTPMPTLTPTSTPPPASAAASPSASPMTAMPDEASMSKADRLRVQDKLHRLSYYKGHVDGFRQTNPPSRASAFLMHCRHDRERNSKRWEAA